MNDLAQELAGLEQRGLLRTLVPLDGADFGSNDYLGYSTNSLIRQRLIEFLKTQPRLGSTGSRLVSGHTSHLMETEEFLAKTFRTPACLIFGSGYLANQGIICTLAGSETEFFSDQFNHASLIDGMRLAKSKYKVFRHNDMDHLNDLLSASSNRRKVIVTESIFSMDGDYAPLNELAHMAKSHNAILVVDEAHSTGTCGPNGLGLVMALRASEQFQDLNPEYIVSVHTCGKALGAYGAFVCCGLDMKTLLLNKARSQIYTTVPSPLMVEHIRVAISHMITDRNSRQLLQANIFHSYELMKHHGLHHSRSHILPFIVGSNDAALSADQTLRDKGLFARAIRSPTVSPGTERLRLTIKATHSHTQIRQLCDLLKEINDEHLRRRN